MTNDVKMQTLGRGLNWRYIKLKVFKSDVYSIITYIFAYIYYKYLQTLLNETGIEAVPSCIFGK